jgi:hypothetical protein
MAYQGEGAYAGLKVAAVVSVILAGIVAVALWFGANDPRIVIDASGPNSAPSCGVHSGNTSIVGSADE